MSCSDNPGFPSCSIVIPTYNRPGALTNCLRAIAAMDYRLDRVEVLVIDDAGDFEPSADHVVSRFTDAMDVRAERVPHAGPAAARNHGTRVARHDAVAFTDDDCAPQRPWLRNLMTALAGAPNALVGGISRNVLSTNLYAETSQLIIDVVHAHFNSNGDRAVFFPSSNMAAERARLLEIGGFDPQFRWSEDRDLCDRWHARGWPLLLARDAVVDHAHVMGLAGFCRQHFGYGRGAWRYHRARARRGAGPMQLAGGFYTRCFREPFRLHRTGRALRLGALLCLWQIANASGFATEAVRMLLNRSGSSTTGDVSARRAP